MRALAPALLLALLPACAPRAALPPRSAEAPEDARLASLPPELRAAVRERRVTRGMSPEVVRLAWGEPTAVARSSSFAAPGLAYERWSYGAGTAGAPAREVWFADGKVVDLTGPSGPPPRP